MGSLYRPIQIPAPSGNVGSEQRRTAEMSSRATTSGWAPPTAEDNVCRRLPALPPWRMVPGSASEGFKGVGSPAVGEQDTVRFEKVPRLMPAFVYGSSEDILMCLLWGFCL